MVQEVKLAASCLLLCVMTSFLPKASAQAAAVDILDPMNLLNTLAGLPPAQQQSLLILAGMSLQSKTGMDCNVFAGELACKALPGTSSYLQQCPGVDPKVDCIYWKHIQDNIYDSPVDNLEEYLKRQEDLPARQLCPECFDKVQSLWCALASPKCGTFKAITQKALLPSLSTVVSAYNRGQSQVEALSGAVSSIFDTMGLALPCREMCEDVVGICGCNAQGAAGSSNATFGALLEWAASQVASQPGSRSYNNFKLPPAFTRLLFKGVWDRPFCTLFQPSSAVGFTGKCTPSTASCHDRSGWCDAINGRHSSAFQYIQGALVLQLSKAVTGWITDDSAGLWRTRDAIVQPADNPDLADLVSKYASKDPHYDHPTPRAGPRPMGPGQVVGIVVLTLTCIGMLGLAGFMAFRYVQTKRSEHQYFELNTTENFKPLVVSE